MCLFETCKHVFVACVAVRVYCTRFQQKRRHTLLASCGQLSTFLKSTKTCCMKKRDSHGWQQSWMSSVNSKS